MTSKGLVRTRPHIHKMRTNRICFRREFSVILFAQVQKGKQIKPLLTPLALSTRELQGIHYGRDIYICIYVYLVNTRFAAENL